LEGALPFGLLALGVALALRAHLRGNPIFLPIMGFVYLLIIGTLLATSAEVTDTYRAYEVVLLGLAAGAPAAAALTSAPLVGGRGRQSVRGASIVYASQVVLLVGYALFAIPTLPAAVVGVPVAIMEREPELLLSALLGWVPAALFVALALGLRAWQRGRRPLLVLANAFALVPWLILAIVGTLSLSSPILAGLGLLIAVPALMLALSALVGIVGGLIVAPPGWPPPLVASLAGEGPVEALGTPPAQDQGYEQTGQGDEVGRVEDQGDRRDSGDGG
jgi:hypothetical protein